MFAAIARSGATAGSIKEVWNAPATASGRTRAPSGANCESASRFPAATICPAPLSFAATSPSSLIAASTTDLSPPRTAAIPAGAIDAALAISCPRRCTNFMASISVIVPASAAAAISPTEWPATSETFT